MKSLFYSLRNIGLLTIALTVALAANFAYGQWADPTAVPPGGAIEIPIHTGNNPQAKFGPLGAVDFFGQVITLDSRAESPAYCDGDGFGSDGIPFTGDDNCFEAADVIPGGSGGGSAFGPALEWVSMMHNAYGVAPPTGMYAWPDWYVCGTKTYDISREREYKDVYEVGGVSRHGFDATGAGDCGGIRNICLTDGCGMYGQNATDGDLVIDPSLICNAFGCSPFGACTAGGCPSSAGDICNAYGCSGFGACSSAGCPTSAGMVCTVYGCS